MVHIAFAYPSRTDLAEYRDYTATVQRLADEINAEFATPAWQPLLLHVDDDFPRSLAAYRLADVALVNPIRDGMNLVAKEVPVVSDNGCALVLSREAGAHAELKDDALTVNPYDVIATADALHAALTMDPKERADRTGRLARRPPHSPAAVVPGPAQRPVSASPRAPSSSTTPSGPATTRSARSASSRTGASPTAPAHTSTPATPSPRSFSTATKAATSPRSSPA